MANISKIKTANGTKIRAMQPKWLKNDNVQCHNIMDYETHVIH